MTLSAGGSHLTNDAPPGGASHRWKAGFGSPDPAFNLYPTGPGGVPALSRVIGAALVGVDGVAVDVEVLISSRLPCVDIVGLAEAAVRESAARVRAAISSVGLKFPDRRVTVNLAPASLRKGGAGLDLPIAVGILAAAGALESEPLKALGLFGELSLDGRIRPVRGALALALGMRGAGCRRLIVPVENGAEASLTPGLEIHSAAHLSQVLAYLNESTPLPRPSPPFEPSEPPSGPDLVDVRGQEQGKRALEIAGAGGHTLLLLGPPGTGKTMLARRLPPLLPALRFDERLEVTRIYGASGHLRPGDPLMWQRPFRAPHHSASRAGVLGGGSPPRPGEVSLAHHGVLFLDELPEFERGTLEALRQVLEERRVHIVRARGSCVFPADFQLVAAANPCPCGWNGSPGRDCRCDDGIIARYRRRLSGPLLDRIDLHVRLPEVRWSELRSSATGATSAEVRQRVAGARRIQEGRGAQRGFRVNAGIPDDTLDTAVAATSDSLTLLGRAVDQLALSARGARRVLRVARTIADLGARKSVDTAAVAEALSYRDSSGFEGIGRT